MRGKTRGETINLICSILQRSGVYITCGYIDRYFYLLIKTGVIPRVLCIAIKQIYSFILIPILKVRQIGT